MARTVSNWPALSCNSRAMWRRSSREKLAEIQSRGAGFGIRGMRERARQFDGEMTIDSNSQGTLFRVTIPMSKNAAAAIEDTTAQEPKTQIA